MVSFEIYINNYYYWLLKFKFIITTDNIKFKFTGPAGVT